MTEPEPRPTTGLRRIRATARAAGVRERLRGPWRVVVSESSMTPTIEPGDWLLVDPTTARWPRRGAIVVFREPDSDLLAIKRVAAGPGERVELDEGHLILGGDEAWLLSDAADADLLAAGAGEPIDSRRYGPVPVDALVGRVWFRYGPIGRIGRIRGSPARRAETRAESGEISG
jgi:signal peptidase I